MSGYTTVEYLLAAMELEVPDAETMKQLGGLIDRVSSLMDGVMGFTFELDPGPMILDGPGASRLLLPAPGAAQVLSLVESGVTLIASQYALEPRMGRYLDRLDAAGAPTLWTSTPRGITITTIPTPPPADLEEICIEECVRRWQGRAAGYPDVVGVAGSNERRYTRAFAPGNYEDLQRIGRDYGVRNLVAI